MDNLTPEQRAIRQFLQRPEPKCTMCGCVGPQPIDSSVARGAFGWQQHHVRISNLGVKRIDVVRLVRKEVKLSMSGIESVFATNSLDLPSTPFQSKCTELASKLNELGATAEVITIGPKMEPLCPCQMRTVEIVDGSYYRILTNRAPDGITHKATRLGEVGGPYINS